MRLCYGCDHPKYMHVPACGKDVCSCKKFEYKPKKPVSYRFQNNPVIHPLGKITEGALRVRRDDEIIIEEVRQWEKIP